MTRFQTDSLTRQPTDTEYAAYVQRRKQGDFGPAGRFGVGVMIAVLAVLGFVGLVVLSLVAGVAFVLIPSLVGIDTSGALGATIGTVITGAVIGLGVWLGVRFWTKAAKKGRRVANLAQFALDNDLNFRLSSSDPAYPGCLFSLGHSRTSTQHVWSAHGQLADCGGYQWTTGSGDDKSVHKWSFAAFRLPRPMPHLLLDARANDLGGFSNLPLSLDRAQRVTLGSPFDDHYTLYAPSGYEQDAHYLFPPDLMALLIDVPATFDIEIIDQWMFLYTPGGMDLTNAATWHLLGDIEDRLGNRMAIQAGRYQDRRSREARDFARFDGYGPGQPAEPARGLMPIASTGRRLRSRFNTRLLVVFLVAVPLLLVLPMIIFIVLVFLMLQ